MFRYSLNHFLSLINSTFADIYENLLNRTNVYFLCTIKAALKTEIQMFKKPLLFTSKKFIYFFANSIQ